MAQKPLFLTGNYAIAYAVKQTDVDVVAAYPITPQTQIAERLSEYVANGELNAEFLLVESEHSALTAATSAAASGARTFTATCSQGLLLMHEILFITSSMRMPVVMALANRAISAPINIWCDHSDIMVERDAGWITLFAENVQEAYDKTIEAFRIAEDPDVLLPVSVNIDGFILSHTCESLSALDDEEVLAFAPKRKRRIRLDPASPMTFGALVPPDYYFEAKLQAMKALEDSLPKIISVDKEYGRLSGREHGIVKPFLAEDADVVMVAMGAINGTIRWVVRQMRNEGYRVGLLSLKLFRPLPLHQILAAAENAKCMIILERALSPGSVGPPLFTEISAGLYSLGEKKLLQSFVAGLGGRDVKPEHIRLAFKEGLEVASRGFVERPINYLGVRK